MVRAVLFDAVGTLIYPDPSVAQAYATSGRRHGQELSEPEVEKRFRRAYQAESWDGTSSPARERARWHSVVSTVFSETADVEPIFADLWQHFANPAHWSVYPDVTDTWSHLAAAGYTLGVASNFDERLLEVTRGLTPLNQSRHVYCSALLGYGKPAAPFFAAIQADLALAAHEILLVGDDWANDVQGARAAGWQAVHLDRRGEDAPGAIRSLAELPDRLAK